MTIYGWDASDFDWPRGPMDLAAARADGISFFTHKATEATDTKHIHYREAMYRAQNAGIPFLGAYHVVRTGDINAQVDYFLAYVNTQTPWWKTFPGWFFQADLEKWPYDAVAPALGVAFAAEVERRTGKRCLLYAPQWAYGNSIGGAAPLWASAYGSNPAGPYRNAYPGDGNTNAWQAYSGRAPAILQFGSQAKIGSQPGCDINAFRGTVADFAALIHGEASLGSGTPITSPTQGDWFDMATKAELQDMLDAQTRTLRDGDPQHLENLTQIRAQVTELRAFINQIKVGDGADVPPGSDTHKPNLKVILAAAVAATDPGAIAAAVVAALPSQANLTEAQVEQAMRNVLHNA